MIACASIIFESEVSITVLCLVCSPRYTAVRIKNCAEEISSVLKVILTESFKTGNLPTDWLTANVCTKKESVMLPVTIDLSL